MRIRTGTGWEWWLLALLLITAAGCQVSKRLPEGRFLYQGGELTVVAPDSVSTTMVRRAGESVIDAQYAPRWRVWWYYRDGFPLGWLGRRLGREPVLYDLRRSQQTVALLENRATNNGHFSNLATFVVDTIARRRTVTVDYELRVGPVYHIDSLAIALPDSNLQATVERLRGQTLLRPGMPYSLASLRAERQRLETALRQQGYYYLTASDFEFLADTLGNDRGVQLLMKVKNGTARRNLIPQRIRRITIFSEFRQGDGKPQDTVYYRSLGIVYRDGILRPQVLDEAFAVRPDSLYRPANHEKTVSRLFSLNTYRYISLNYEEVPGADSLLDLYAYLTPNLSHSIAGEVGAAYNSGRYFGPELGLRYANRNLLRGAELFTLDGDLTYNFFLGNSAESRIPRSGVYQLEAGLQVPRLWLPNRRHWLPGLRQSATLLSAGGKLEQLNLNLNRFINEINAAGLTDLQDRLAADPNATSRVRLFQLSGQYGYTWQRRAALVHRAYPINLRYQNPRVSTEELLTLSRSLGFTQGLQGLGRLDRMLLFGPSYQLVYDTRLNSRSGAWHHFFLQLDLALNFNRVLPVGDNERQLQAENSRYLQPKVDARYYWRLSRPLTLAARAHAGIALPFTERAIVPYFDLYTVGGPNSLRGFIPRGLGPGETVPENNNLLSQNGYGNVLLESSLELRYRLTDMFALAAFFDAGNVWLYRTETTPTPGDIDFGNFFSDLGTNAGLGLRIDLSFLLLRLDFARPLHLPYPTTAPDRKWRFVLAFGEAF
ncbi:MAG: BamA/TamA family outer membrane protein [Lewinella sp.]|nr:BamA/TamA family outer membrane protein [Lewinella sp.]